MNSIAHWIKMGRIYKRCGTLSIHERPTISWNEFQCKIPPTRCKMARLCCTSLVKRRRLYFYGLYCCKHSCKDGNQRWGGCIRCRSWAFPLSRTLHEWSPSAESIQSHWFAINVRCGMWSEELSLSVAQRALAACQARSGGASCRSVLLHTVNGTRWET